VALRIVSEEHVAAKRGENSVGKPRKMHRHGSARYAMEPANISGSNDLQPRIVMHPIKPELNGRDATDMKDPNGKRLFVEFVDVVKRQGAGFVAYEWRSRERPSRSRSCPSSPASSPGVG